MRVVADGTWGFASGADVTVGCVEVPVAEAKGFGVMHVAEDGRIVDAAWD